MPKSYYENYIEDNLKISPSSRFIYGRKDKEALSRIEDDLSDEYLEKINQINEKYKKIKEIQLKEEIEDSIFYMENKLYLLLFSSYHNFILTFNYDNNNVYPQNKEYKKSRSKDFAVIVNTTIEKAKEGIKENITYPKIIIKKFLKQIRHLHNYNSFYKFILKSYLPHCRNEIGICYIKNGKEIYKKLVKDNIGHLDITPEEIHELGKKLIKHPIKHSKNTYKSRNEFMKDCIRYANLVYDNIIDKYFYYKPKKRFVLVPVHKSLEKSSPLGYYNEVEKKVFINLSYYYEIDKNEVYAFILHECIHYYHFKYVKHLKVPYYKIMGYTNNALVEGFAHYMEIYSDNYDDDKNSFTLLRKLRLVVDTGINYYGWTYKQGLDYLNKYLPKKTTDNINEIDRYICMPGQALGYLTGKLHIINLRDDFLEKKKGNIKDFHEQLLIEGIASFTIINKKFNYNRKGL